MGNKSTTNSPSSPTTSSHKSSFLDLKNFTKKKTLPKDDFFKICGKWRFLLINFLVFFYYHKPFLIEEPSIFYGQCLQVEPDENIFEIKCVFCKCLNFDDGLETPTRCIQCNNLYIAKDSGIQK